MNSKGISNSSEIKSCTTCNWLYKPSLKYKNIKKDVFIDGYKRRNIVSDYKYLLKELKPYLVKCNKDGIRKDKKYLLDHVIKDTDQRSLFIMTHDKSIFSANDGI